MSIFTAHGDLSFDKIVDIKYLQNSTEFDNDEFFLILDNYGQTVFFGVSEKIKDKRGYLIFDNVTAESDALNDSIKIKELSNNSSILEDMANIIVDVNINNKKSNEYITLLLTMNKSKFIEFLKFYQNPFDEKSYLVEIFNQKTVKKIHSILKDGIKKNNGKLDYINFLFSGKGNEYDKYSVKNDNDIKDLLYSNIDNDDVLYSIENKKSLVEFNNKFNDLISSSEYISAINKTNLLITNIYFNSIRKIKDEINLYENPLHFNFNFNKEAKNFVDVAREVGLKDNEITIYLNDLMSGLILEASPIIIVDFFESIKECYEKLSINKSVNAIKFISHMHNIPCGIDEIDLKNRYCNLLTEKERSKNKKKLVLFNPTYFECKENDFYKDEELRLVTINLQALNNIRSVCNNESLSNINAALKKNSYFKFLYENDGDVSFIIDKNKIISAEDFVNVVFKAIEENSTNKNINDDFSSNLIDLYFREYFLSKKLELSNENKGEKVLLSKNKI